jgi:hypothetical protein
MSVQIPRTQLYAFYNFTAKSCGTRTKALTGLSMYLPGYFLGRWHVNNQPCLASNEYAAVNGKWYGESGSQREGIAPSS